MTETHDGGAAGPSDVELFTDRNLRGARFVRSDLGGVVMRAVDIAGADIDAPWLLDGESTLVINGVNVAPLIEAELNSRYPGRSERRAQSVAELREAWEKVQAAWDGTISRVRAMPEGTADESVDGEWSFAQTVRHLIMATDTWLGRGILGIAQPFHPIGQPDHSYGAAGHDMSVFSDDDPTFDDVLSVRAERVTAVRDFLARSTDRDLEGIRTNPWFPRFPETVRSCLHTILEEEWEHLRFAERDLEVLAAGDGGAANLMGKQR